MNPFSRFFGWLREATRTAILSGVADAHQNLTEGADLQADVDALNIWLTEGAMKPLPLPAPKEKKTR